MVHGFHPFAEDGGLYAAGVEYTLDRTLFPHYTAFVTAHLRYSLFAPATALLVHVTHLSLPATLLLLDFLAALLTLLAARALLRRCIADERAQLAGLAMLAAGWTLPIAGTSLYLMDPYVTARSFTLPLALLAIAFALDLSSHRSTQTTVRCHPEQSEGSPHFARGGKHLTGSRSNYIACAICLSLAATLHPLMAVYALLFVLVLRATGSHRSKAAWLLLILATLTTCLTLQAFSPADSPAERAAIITRYYWFLSQWHWYELLGLLGPFVMLAIVLRTRLTTQSVPLRTLAQAATLLGLTSLLCALFFAHESSNTHTVARLQPLRAFVLVYVVMLLLLGAAIYSVCQRAALRALPALAIAAMAAGLFLAARATYPASPHIELPWQSTRTPNPWAQAFLWARANTPPDALFALDALYVNTDGEDAQTFRAISFRSALPDYSKDGGEASITPSLAPVWLAAADAQKDLSSLTESERDHRLAPFNATWMIVRANTKTAHPCPYRNGTVKVCRLRS